MTPSTTVLEMLPSVVWILLERTGAARRSPPRAAYSGAGQCVGHVPTAVREVGDAETCQVPGGLPMPQPFQSSILSGVDYRTWVGLCPAIQSEGLQPVSYGHAVGR